MVSNTPHQSGFALLITLIVVGVVVSVGLSILELSTKQVRLASNTKDSETAFHAANAGVECALFIRRSFATQMEEGQQILPSCFGTTPTNPTVNATNITGTFVPSSNDGAVYQYQYEFTWGTSPNQRCTRVTTLVTVANDDPVTIDRSDVQSIIPGYPTPDTVCEPGSRCTIMSVRGLNRSCTGISTTGTIEREVLLEF
jgi:hypothetical protein